MGVATKIKNLIKDFITKVLQKRSGAFVAFLFLAIVVAVFARSVIFRGTIPFPSSYLVSFFPPWSAYYSMPVKNNAMPDVITQMYPWKKFTIDQWKDKEIPLWNPHSFAGTVHAANYQSAVFSPFNLLFFFLPHIQAWSVLILLQPLLAGFFQFLFLRSLGRTHIASMFGAVSFMFCGFLVVWMAYGTLGYAALFLPLILWASTVWNKKRVPYAFLGIVLGVCLSFFSGHFQISLYVLCYSIAYILFGQRGSRFASLYALLGVFLGVCIAAPQLLLTYNAFTESVRGTSLAAGGISWKYIATFIAPDFYGNPVTRNDWFGTYAEWSGYIGVVPLLLSIFACIYSPKNRTILFFIIAACTSFLFAYISPLNQLIYTLRIPVLSTSAASRIIVLTSFSLSIVASYGLDEVQKRWNEKFRMAPTTFMMFVFILLGILWGVVTGMKPFEQEKLLIAQRNLIMPTAIAFLCICIVYAGFIRHWFLGQRKVRNMFTSILLALVIFEMTRFAYKWMPFEKKEYIYPEIPVITFIDNRVGIDRVFGNFGNEFGTYYGVSAIEGYDAMYQSRYGEFISAAYDTTIRTPIRSVVLLNKQATHAEDALRLLGVRYFLHRLSDGRQSWVYPFWNYDSYQSIFKDDQYEVFENTAAYPRAFTVQTYTVQKESKDIITTLFSKDFDKRHSIVLEKDPSISMGKTESSSTIVSYKPQKIVVDVDTQDGTLLFLSDPFDDGWRATIDGKSTEILRANYAFRAVAVPSGNHTIEFRYKPKELEYGIFISLLGVLITGVIVWLQHRYAYRNI